MEKQIKLEQYRTEEQAIDMVAKELIKPRLKLLAKEKGWNQKTHQGVLTVMYV